MNSQSILSLEALKRLEILSNIIATTKLPKKVDRKPKKPETLEEENQRLKKELEVLRFLQEEGEVSMDCRAKRTIFSILFG